MTLESIFHPPSADEMSARLAKVQAQMAEVRLDWYVCFQPDNVYYLTNFANFIHERPFILLVPASGRLRFVVPKLEIPHVESRAVGEIDLAEYFEFPAPEGRNWFNVMESVIGQASRVGVESVCQLQIYEAVSAERVRTDIIDDLRMIKSPYEIGRLVYGGKVVSAAMKNLLDNAQIGQSLAEVRSRTSGLMLQMLMADNPSINPFATKVGGIFQPARYSYDPHNFSDLKMHMEKGGPHVSIINSVLNGYGSEIERTFFLGSVPEAAKRPFETMMQGRDLAFRLTQPGTRMCDVDKAVNDLFKSKGYEANLLHRTGHGMGVTAHEAPFLAEGDTRVIEPGMSFTIEPGIYLRGVGGFRHSDTIVVTDDGNMVVTDAPASLEALTL